MNYLEATTEKLKSSILEYLTKAGHSVSLDDVFFEKPSNSNHGDISTNIALKYANRFGLSPITLAQDISIFLTNKQIQYVEKIEAVKPGFINVTFNTTFYNHLVKEIIRSPNVYGKNDSLAGTEWVVEHTSPNPNKAMHLGHLRNNLVGTSLVHVLQWNGAHVVSDAVDNNRGIAIAKLMWGFLSHMKKGPNIPTDVQYWVSNQEQWYTPEEKGMLPDIFVTECYVLGESEFKKDSNVENIVRNLVVQWENSDKDVRLLWSHVLSYAYTGMNRTLTRLGNHWDKIWHEHEHYQEGKKYVYEGLEKGLFNKLEDGAILTNLEKYKIPDTILLKNDGTSLYITQDIALTALKKQNYDADNLVWVIGPEQSLAMKQLFAVCEQLGIGKMSDFTHVAYGYVGLKDEGGGFKKMSSRAGTVVLIDDVINEVKDKILERLNEDRTAQADENTKSISEKMALAAVKFSILKSDRNQDLTFDTEQSIETTGDSGIYVLYTYVRTQAILRKAQSVPSVSNHIAPGLEIEVVKQIAHFPYVIKRAKEDLSAHHIAQYMLELCSAFNSWYGKETVLDGSEREGYKLAVTKAVGSVIHSGLSILGIDTVEEI